MAHRQPLPKSVMADAGFAAVVGSLAATVGSTVLAGKCRLFSIRFSKGALTSTLKSLTGLSISRWYPDRVHSPPSARWSRARTAGRSASMRGKQARKDNKSSAHYLCMKTNKETANCTLVNNPYFMRFSLGSFNQVRTYISTHPTNAHLTFSTALWFPLLQLRL